MRYNPRFIPWLLLWPIFTVPYQFLHAVIVFGFADLTADYHKFPQPITEDFADWMKAGRIVCSYCGKRGGKHRTNCPIHRANPTDR